MSRRYRAFISYSHQDETWARWLQRALESYRFPKGLVGQPARHGEVPRRFRPVFRDREDFSSATDLSAEVRRTLEDSDALIIICSPAAAASRWVNEEIRVFQSLGRADDIHCVVVAGDPASRTPGEDCFPPALKAHETEPLAVDVRPWADGRLLAKLKLLAGMMGLRLDELRRRDLQRRHRIWAISGGTALLVALVTSVLAIIAFQKSIEAERERAQADRERAEAERMASFLANLPAQVDQAGRLELMESLGSEAREWLERLEPGEYNDQTLEVLATVQRSDGNVQSRRGDLEDALKMYEGSLESYQALSARHPQDTERLFELGNAEFHVGNTHFQRGDYQSADEHFSRYRDIARRLVQAEPDNSRWVMERAYVDANLAILESSKTGANIDSVLSMLRQAQQNVERARVMEPDNEQYIEDAYEIQAHLADALMRRCDLGAALESRIGAEALMGRLARAHPDNFDHQTKWSHALIGLANVQAKVGMQAEALDNAQRSAQIARSQAAAEPDNTQLQWHGARTSADAAALQDAMGEDQAAWNALQAVEADMMRIINEVPGARVEWISSHALVLGRMSKLAAGRGDTAHAQELEQRALERLKKALATSPEDYLTRLRLTDLAYPAWEGERVSLEPELEQATLDFGSGEHGTESCVEADIGARQAWLRENRPLAEQFTRYLLGKGYWEPEFMQFCRGAGLCTDATRQGS